VWCKYYATEFVEAELSCNTNEEVENSAKWEYVGRRGPCTPPKGRTRTRRAKGKPEKQHAMASEQRSGLSSSLGVATASSSCIMQTGKHKLSAIIAQQKQGNHYF
jgi:hypothetical protein